MAQRIESLISDNKLLSDAVAHDLRTPLARLRFGIEMLQETELARNQRKTPAASYLATLMRWKRLVNVLLNYARIEQSMSRMTENHNVST